MSRRSSGAPGTAGPAPDPTAVPAAAGLALLAVGGWLLTTARPWHKPGHVLTLALGWTVSGALLVSGLVLLTRCVRTVHATPDAPALPDAPKNPENA